MNKPKVSAIVAMDEKRGIGKDNSIPWKIPGEQKMFREITMPHPMIMGRKTFESLGRILPGRPHIVITRDTNYKVEGVAVVHSLEEGLEMAKDLESKRMSSPTPIGDPSVMDSRLRGNDKEIGGNDKSAEVFIIGGGQIFNEALEKAMIDRLYLTIIEGDFGADTYFPDYSEFTKKVTEENKEVEGYKYKFLILEK